MRPPRYRLMTSLGRWVVKTVLRALAEAQRSGQAPMLFAISLSGQPIGDEAFLAFAREELELTAIAEWVENRETLDALTDQARVTLLVTTFVPALLVREPLF